MGYYQPPTNHEKARRDDDGKPEGPRQCQKQATSDRPMATAHKPMTLDQYYYPTLIDTDWRDKDQVLSKYLTWKSKELHDKLSKEQSHSTTTETADQTEQQNPRRILKVDQIWMWIIDESMELRRILCWNHADIILETVITASTETTPLDERQKDSLL